MRSENPLVSVCMVSYNQEKYIGLALDSILSQKCNFKYEVLIGDDLSSDKTRDILKQYAAKCPDVIFPMLHEKNLGYQGQVNFTRVLEACKGKYIAVLEGDDVWADDHKLQKQFDFMEQNPDFIMCFSAVNIIDSNGKVVDQRLLTLGKDVINMEDIILSYSNMLPTPTLFFRNQLPHPLPDFFSKAQNGDIALHYMLAPQGKIKYMADKTASYRSHATSVTKTQEHIDNFYNALIQLYNDVDKFYNYTYTKLFRQRILQLSKIRLIDDAKNHQGFDRLKHYFKAMPDYLKYSEKLNLKEIFYYHMVLFFPFVLKKIKSPSEETK